MAIWSRRAEDLSSLVHHSDRGVLGEIKQPSQHLTEKELRWQVVSGVDRTGRTLEQVELATAEWVGWWNHRRLRGAAGDVPPAEYEDLYYCQRDTSGAA